MKTLICVIGGIFVIWLFVFSGCAANKSITESDMSVTAEGTSEGIVLHFSNIPEDTSDIVLMFVNIFDKNQPESIVFINYENLDKLKKTGVFLCPFGKEGYEYFIRIHRDNELGARETFYTGAVAGGGIYLTNKPTLSFTNDNKTLALSEMPAFSEEVSFSKNSSLNYYSYLRRDNGHFLGFGASVTDDLNTDSWLPDDDMKEILANEYSVNFTGNMPIFATVNCIVNYENMEWIIGFAETQDVIVSF